MHGLLLAVAAFTAQAQGPLHYKVESSAITNVDMSGMGMASQQIVVSSKGRITVTMSDTAGGKLANIVVDSVEFDGGDMLKQAIAMGSVPPEALADGKGTTVHCFIPVGKGPSCDAPSTQAISAASLAAAFPILFTGIKPAVKMGDVWADTVKKDTTIAAPGLGTLTGTVSSVTAWKASSMSGQDFVLDATIGGTLTAAIPGGMGNMDMTNSGTQHVVGSPGKPMKEATAMNKATGKLSMAGAAIPVTVNATMKVVVVP